jgi:hypothetical protein
MPGVSKFTKEKKEEFLEKFVNNNFNLTVTCKEVGVTPTSFYNAMMYDDKFKAEVDLYKKIAKTMVDNAILRGINDPDVNVAAKYLDLIGKHPTFQTIFNLENKGDLTKGSNTNEVILE